jgi:hypothetical protein
VPHWDDQPESPGKTRETALFCVFISGYRDGQVVEFGKKSHFQVRSALKAESRARSGFGEGKTIGRASR